MIGRLRAARRTARVVFTDGFRAGPTSMALTTLFTVLSSIALVAYVIGFKTMSEAVLTHNSTELFDGALEVAVLYTLGWSFQLVGATERSELTNRVTLYQRSKIAALVAGVPTIEHFERPDYLQELDLLHDNIRLLSSGPGQVLSALQTLLTTATIVVLLAVISPILIVLPLFGVPPVLANRWSVRIRERADESVAEQRRLADELFSLSATAGPAKELRLSGSQHELQARYDALSQQVSSAVTRASVRGAALGCIGWLIFAIGFVGAVIIVVVQAAHRTTSISDVIVIVSLLRRAQLQVGQSANLAGQLSTIARHARRFQWLEDFALDDRSTHAARSGVDEATSERSGSLPPRTRPGHRAQGAVPHVLRRGIALDRVVFRYPGTDTEVLRSVDLELPAGSTVAIVGENGAGKTTVVKLLCGMYRPDSGVVNIDGVALDTMDLDEWRRRTSATFQDFVRYELTAGQTVGVGDLPRLDDDGAVRVALERASATDLVAEIRDGLATPVGRSFANGQDLSGGQWQKLALSRGMMRDLPLLVVLDEPTASLDAPTEHTIFQQSMRRARRIGADAGAVTLLISHRFSTVRMADRIVVLEHGQILEQGTHEVLLRYGGKYAELFEMQARSYR